MTYNATFLDTSNNLYDVFIGVSTSTNNVVPLVILFVIFVISYVSTSKEGTKIALTSSSLITSIIAMLMFFIGIIPMYIVLLPLTMFIFLFMIRFFE